MAIINALPYNIANGQSVDATPLMADLNQIVGNVNANAAGLSQQNTFTSGAVFQSTVQVGGELTVTSGAVISGATQINSTLTVSGATQINSTLTVSGATQINSTLTVSGATQINSTLAVSGAITASTAATPGTTQVPQAQQLANDSLPIHATSGPGATPFALRNRIINGAMDVDQRNNGAAVSSGVNATTYTVDRWSVAAAGAAVTAQRLGTVGNYYLNITGATGVTQCNVRHRIESYNIGYLAGSQVTLSFSCSSNTLPSIQVSLGYASAQDNFGTITNIYTTTQTISSTNARYTVTVTLPSGAANGLEIEFLLGAFTSGAFAITKVQLEAGPTATPFEQRPYGMELALCQRYYEATDSVHNSSPSTQYATGYWKVIKRTTPTISSVQVTGSGMPTFSSTAGVAASAFFQSTAPSALGTATVIGSAEL